MAGPLNACRTLLALFCCASVAYLALFVAGELRPAGARRGVDPMLGYYPPDMPRYPGVEELPAGDSTEVGASRMRMSLFNSEDEPARVARFYADFWRVRRLFVREDVTHVGGVVSAVDAEGSRVFQVLLLTRDGRTLAFPSVTEAPLLALEDSQDGRHAAPTGSPALSQAADGAEETAAGSPGAPTAGRTSTAARAAVAGGPAAGSGGGDSAGERLASFPGARTMLRFSTREGGTRARITLAVYDGTVDDGVAHYTRELRAAGYALESSQTPGSLSPGGWPGSAAGAGAGVAGWGGTARGASGRRRTSSGAGGAAAEQRLLLYRKEGGEVTVNLMSLGARRVRLHLVEVES